jgi:S1-C subfamily serine protease
MAQPSLPDWLIYCGTVAAVAFAAITWRQRADAPPAPPPVPGASDTLAAEAPFDPRTVKPVPDNPLFTRSGTAFSVSSAGVWLTARHVVDGCRRVAVVVADGRGVVAQVTASHDADVAVLKTEGGGPPLPVADRAVLYDGQRAFHPGYPKGEPGEATSIYLGRDEWRDPARGARPQAVMALAESGRTDGASGSLAGLSGAPVLDGSGRVVGVTLGESPRRGRLYAAPSEAIRSALARAKVDLTGLAQAEPLDVDNYGRVADGLRRDLRVAEVACLT